MDNGLQTLLGDGVSIKSYKSDGRAIEHAFKVSDNYPWDDFDFSVNNLRVSPVTSKPDYDSNEGEFLFDSSTTETVVGSRISRHEFASDQTEWRPHVHWAQNAPGNVVWRLEYKIWPANTEEPAYTAISAFTGVFSYTSGVLHQITPLPAVNVTAYSAYTAMMVKVKISRIGGDANDTMAVDARFLGFDFHVQIDKYGSINEVRN